MKDLKEEVAKEIIRARQYRGLTQLGLAEKIGVSQSYIARLENGKHMPSLKTITKIADALGASVTTGFANVGGKPLTVTHYK